jgi:FtsP/CotA-like multicopper oxidase with cupredoxin domain
MALSIVRRQEVHPDERPAFLKHVCPPTFGGENPDPQQPTVMFKRNLLTNHDLLLPNGQRVNLWVIEDPDDMEGGRVFPSKMIRVKRNEVVQVQVSGKGEMHTIHWHGIEPTPMNDGVGKHSFEITGNFVYQFQPRYAGTYFFHCHVNTTLHFEMGLYGMLIIDPDVEGAPFRTGGPGMVSGVNRGNGSFLIPYDLEAFWVADEFDTRWHTLKHKAFMQDCRPADPVAPDSFTQDGFLNDFRPDVFLITGVPRVDDATPIKAPLVSLDAQVGQTLLVRVLNAGYTVQKYYVGLDAEVIAMDGRALGVPPASKYSHPFRVPAGTPITLTSARRNDLIIRPMRAGVFPVRVDYHDWVSGKKLATARTTITVS